MTLWAKIQFKVENTHRWENMPEGFQEDYLVNWHRHNFHVTMWIEQFNDDRDVEYLQTKHKVKDIFPDFCISLQDKSCEQICKIILIKGINLKEIPRQFDNSVIRQAKIIKEEL